MMCLAWNAKTKCYNAGAGAGTCNGADAGGCPRIGWFWAMLAGAVVLSMGKGNRSR